METVKELKEKLQKVQGRLRELPTERDRIQQRLDTAKEKHSQIESQITKLRKERQATLVDEGHLEDVNTRLKEVRKMDEVLEDEIEGLSGKLSELDKEKQYLEANEVDLRKNIFKKEKIRPLVGKYNEKASELANILIGIDDAAHEYRHTFSSQGGKLIQSYSDNTNNHGVVSLPAIWMFGEEPLSEHYNRSTVVAGLNKKDAERFMKDKYPNCKCFQCPGYDGTGETYTVHCNLIGGTVTQDILLGQTKEQKSREAERCYSFHAAQITTRQPDDRKS